MKNKELCDCGKVAVWCYMPGRDDGVFCDDCVSRGCSCNYRYVDVNSYDTQLNESEIPTDEDYPIKWIEKDKIWCHVDENGLEFPCCEFMYDENGWDK